MHKYHATDTQDRPSVVAELLELLREDSHTWLDQPVRHLDGPTGRHINPRWQRMIERRRRIEVLRRQITTGTR